MVPTPTADDRRTPTRPNLLQPPTVERKKMAREKKLYRRFELRNTIILKKKQKFTSSEKMSGPEWAVKKKWPRPHFRGPVSSHSIIAIIILLLSLLFIQLISLLFRCYIFFYLNFRQFFLKRNVQPEQTKKRRIEQY